MQGWRNLRPAVAVFLSGPITAGLGFCLPAFADITGADFRLKAADVFEHTTDFMVTLSLALFALVGYFGKDRLAKSGCRRASQLVVLGLFFAASVASLLCAYFSRLEIVSHLASGTFDYTKLHCYVVQAWTLVVAAFFAAVFLLIAM